LGSRWQEVMSAIKPVEGIVNKVLAALVLVVVVWLGMRIWRRRRHG
jgi:hypothetical protein